MIRSTVHAFGLAIIALGFLVVTAPPARATSITYNVVNVSGSTWQYDYVVTNDSLGTDLLEFTVFFDRTQYQNLTVTSSPVGWDSLVAQPDLGLPDDGYFDSLATGTGINPDASLAGFAVTFDYLGTGTPPGLQHFDVINPLPFAVLPGGTTTPVPAPGAAWLLATGLLSLVPRSLARRRRGRVCAAHPDKGP